MWLLYREVRVFTTGPVLRCDEMALTPSTMLPLGSLAPAFALRDAVSGRTCTLDEFSSQPALLVMFVCNHCPYVVHVRSQFAHLEKDFAARGLAMVAINSNSEKSHPQDGPSHMAELAREEGWHFPFLFDATQEVAHAYRAACTPDFFLFDRTRQLVYRGQLDDSRPENGKPVTGRDLRAAIEAVLGGRAVDAKQHPSMGCNIKWHA